MGAAEQTLIVLAVMAVLFVTEIIPLAITSLGGAIALGLMGIITPKVVFSGLSDSTVVLFAGMFVVGAALFYTGLAQKIGETVVSHAGTSENENCSNGMAMVSCCTRSDWSEEPLNCHSLTPRTNNAKCRTGHYRPS